MKRFLSVFLTLTMLTTLLGGMTVFAAPVTTAVIADEGWENATYDEDTGILTNVDGGYSLKINGNIIEPVADQNITAEKVVIPSSIATSGGTLNLTTISSGVLVGVAFTGTGGTETNEAVKEIIISEGITTIDKYAFQNSTALTTVSVPSTLTAINEYAFNKSTVAEINLPDGLKTIKKGAFQYCTGLTEITIPDLITAFSGNEVFRGCAALSKVTLSSAMTETNSGGGAFRDCSSLTSITFPETLAKLHKNDFYNCTSLKEVIFTSPTAPSLNSASFSKCSGMTVTLPGNGEGYDDTWKAILPSDTTFKYTRGNPRAENAALEGFNLVGATLTVTYTYFDPEDRAEEGSTILWEASTTEDFSENVTEIKTESCLAGASYTYTLTDAEDGSYIRATIVVRNSGDDLNEGSPVTLSLTEAVRVPVTKPTVAISNYTADEEVAVNEEVDINASATCDNTTITKVEFYVGETLLSEDTEAPYSVKWTPIEEGAVELSAIAYNALGESTASEKTSVTVVEKIPYYIFRTSSPGVWGSFGNTTVTNTPNASEDGLNNALVFTGGSGSGGCTLAILNNKTAQYDKYGNKIGETVGMIDASEFVIRYKSDCSFRITFRLEYRVTGGSKSSKTITIPSTSGEWSTVKIPFSDFMKSDEPEDMWIYDMASIYTSNYNPVVMLKVEGIKLSDGKSLVIDHIGANWYEDEMISKIEFNEEPKMTYFQHYDSYDYTTGSIALYRGSSEEPEIFALDHPMVTVSGFQNSTIKNNATDSKNTKITVKLFGKSLTYYIRVVEFAPETLTGIQVNEPKTEYYVGDPFDYETGLIQANYSDKDPEFSQLDNLNATIEGFDSSTEGEKTITVTYGGQSTTYTINVTAYTVTGVTDIRVNNPRKIYSVGEAFNYHDGDITVVKNDTTTETLDLYNRYVTITGFDSSAVAEDQEITVSYSGITTTYTIDIIDSQAPVAYYNTLDMESGNRPAVWYPSSGTSFVEGAGVDGVKTAMRFDNRATYQCAFTGGWAFGSTSTNVSGITANGLKGVDAISVTYRSYSDTSIQIKMDYRASDKATLSSATPILPSTGGIWKTVVLPIAEFEPAQTGDSFDQKVDSVDWVYTNIMGGGTMVNGSYQFEPVILLYIKAGNGEDQPTYIDNIKGLWYDNLKTVESINLVPEKTVYYDNEEFDTAGTATITYDDGTSVTGSISDYDIYFTGFNSNVTEAATQTITATYGGKSTTYDVEVRTGGNDVIASALSEDVVDVYLIGDEFNREEGSIIFTLANGKQNIIPLSDSDVTITGFDSSAQNTNLTVTIAYGDYSFDLRVRVYKPTLIYSSPSFTDGNGNTITSFGGVETVNTNIKVRNRVACETPQTAVIFAAVYSSRNALPLVKKLTDTPIPASTETTLTATFTAEELQNASVIKIIALDSGETISNLLDSAAVIYK